MDEDNDRENVVILFPNQERSAIDLQDEGISEEEIITPIAAKAIEDARDAAQIQTMATLLLANMGNTLDVLGFDPQKQPQEFCFLSESIVSLLCAHYDRHHDLQTVAQAVIVVDDAESLQYHFQPPKMTYMPKDDDLNDNN